ncbi:MAG: DUF4304 domain-containing protein [Nitrospirae bacterium]|nr:DUF4304 domain-containing protein [Nitrospirota bacterium]
MAKEKKTSTEEEVGHPETPATGGAEEPKTPAEEKAADRVDEMAVSWQRDVLITFKEPVTLSPEEKKEHARVHRLLLKKLDNVFGESGFERKGLTWRREMGDFIHVVSLVKYKIRGEKYLRYALSVNAMIKELKPKKQNPKDHDCHYRGRFETIAASDENDQEEKWRIEEDLDFDDKSKSEDEKLESLSRTLEEKIFPFLDVFNSVDDIDVETFGEKTRIRRILTEVQAKHARIRKRAQ